MYQPYLRSIGGRCGICFSRALADKAPEPEHIAGYDNEEEAHEHDLSEDEAEHELLVLLRNLRRAREAAEAEESENEEEDAEESDDAADATDAPEIDSDHDHVFHQHHLLV